MQHHKCYDGVSVTYFNHTLQGCLLWTSGGRGGLSEKVSKESDMEDNTWYISENQQSEEMENSSGIENIICEGVEAKEDLMFLEK